MFSTGINALDKELGSTLECGRYVLFSGPQGGGKTIMAGQLTLRAIAAEQHVLFISTEVSARALLQRMVSARCSQEYGSVMDGIRTQPAPDDRLVPSVIYGEAFAAQYRKLLRQVEIYCRFFQIRSLTFAPGEKIRSICDEYVQAAGRRPDLVILDYINAPKDKAPSATDEFELREAMLASSRMLKELAVEHRTLAVGFCQMAVDHYDRKKVGPEAIEQCKHLADPADAFIGISRILAPETAEEIYQRVQLFNVCVHGRPSRTIRVDANFAFQRFEDIKMNQHLNISKGGSSEITTTQRASAHQGYVLMGRERFLDVCEIAKPSCINVYYFLLLVANYRNVAKFGCSFWSRAKLADSLGMTVKQILTASECLAENGFIAVNPDGSPRSQGRSIEYSVSDWREDQNPKMAKNYLKLFRNLRDESRRDLLGSPKLLRLWLYFLASARGLRDDTRLLAPGCFVLQPEMIEEHVGVARAELPLLLQQLARTQRIGAVNGPEGQKDFMIRNWSLYQEDLCSRASTGEATGK